MDLNYRLLIRISGLVLTVTGISMLPPFLCALYYGEESCMRSFFICSLLFIILGVFIFTRFQRTRTNLKIRDGYIIVAFCWIFSCIFGAIPYYFSGYGLTVTQSIFEATAGFTTTGASTIVGELAPRSLLLFRSVTHWLGGMGILVLAVSILPALGIGGQNLARAEMPSPKIDKVTNKISDSARILYLTYFLFTILEFLLLLFSRKMNPFESLVNTLSTISTGGLMTHANGLAYYDSMYVEIVITIFSFLVAINFNLYYFAIHRRFREVVSNAEFRTFTCMIAVTAFLIALNLASEGIYESFGASLRHSLTQVMSFATTSGFSFADFNSWPIFSKMLLFSLMLIGGCAASTSGGMKVIRAMVCFKLIRRGFRTRIHPRSVVSVKIGREPLTPGGVSQITTFILAYIAVFTIGFLLLSIDSIDLETSIGTAASALSNTGISFGNFGAAGDYSIFSPFSQIVLSFLMIIGRLELFTVLILFTPGFWNPVRQKN